MSTCGRAVAVFLFFSLTFVFSPTAQAYIGPGLGTGVIASVLGTLFGLIMLIVGVVWYPIKRIVKRLRRTK